MSTLFDPSISTSRVCVNPSSAPQSQGDSWLALDFILALEHPCRDHVEHSPEVNNGHALTMTLVVYTRAQPPSHTRLSRESRERWQVPYSEVEKYVPLSCSHKNVLAWALQAGRASWKARARPRRDDAGAGVCGGAVPQPPKRFERDLVASEAAPAPYAECFGFGAVLPSEIVWRELKAVQVDQ